MKDFSRKVFSGLTYKIGIASCVLLFLGFAFGAKASTGVVINEVYPGGGNGTGTVSSPYSTYNQDFVELYNNGTNSINISGYSLQYASTSGSATSYTVCTISATDTLIEPGTYFLIAVGTASSNSLQGAALPTADATCSLGGGIATAGGKLALVNGTTALSNTTCPATSGAVFVDFVGYGNSTCFEGTAVAPTPSNTTSIQRTPVGTDSDRNNLDFTTGAPTPFNSLSADLTISQSAPSTVTIASNYTYTLTVKNTGGTNLTNVDVDFTLPSGVTYFSSGGTCSTITQTAGVVQFRGCTVNANSTADLTVTVLAPATPQTVTSTGTNVVVDPNTTIVEPNELNNTATTITTSVNVTTAAMINVGGQVTNFKGHSVAGVLITLTDSNGNKYSTYTDDSGNYLFEGIEVGQVLIFEARAKRYTFTQPMQVVSLTGESATVNFVGYEAKRFF